MLCKALLRGLVSVALPAHRVSPRLCNFTQTSVGKGTSNVEADASLPETRLEVARRNPRFMLVPPPSLGRGYFEQNRDLKDRGSLSVRNRSTSQPLKSAYIDRSRRARKFPTSPKAPGSL